MIRAAAPPLFDLARADTLSVSESEDENEVTDEEKRVSRCKKRVDVEY